MPARMCNVSAELDLKGANVQVLDYRWSVDEQIYECDEVFILRYRPKSAKVSVAARLKDGRVQDFGQLMFFPARMEIRTTPAKSSELTRNVMCSFSAEWLQKLVPDLYALGKDPVRCLDIHNARIEQLMQSLASEATCPGFASHLMAESLAQVAAIEVARHFNNYTGSRRIRTFEGRFSEKEINRVYEYIHSVSNKSPDTAEVSKNCGISPAHLRRSFKRTTGLTLHEYVTKVRLSKAQTLLAETELPLKEVAYRLGFASSSTFSSTFRKDAGETPSSYRQRLHRTACT